MASTPSGYDGHWTKRFDQPPEEKGTCRKLYISVKSGNLSSSPDLPGRHRSFKCSPKLTVRSVENSAFSEFIAIRNIFLHFFTHVQHLPHCKLALLIYLASPIRPSQEYPLIRFAQTPCSAATTSSNFE